MTVPPPSRRPEGYFLQSGCHDCKHAWVQHSDDDADKLFCTQDGAPRPRSGGSDPAEEWEWRDQVKCYAQADAWFAWAEPRFVCQSGRCPQHERKA